MPERSIGSLLAGCCLGVASLAWPMLAAGQVAPKSTARAEAGAIVARGNSQSESFTAKFDIAREWEDWKQAFGTSAVYAADPAGATGQRWDVRSQTDYKFHAKGFSFGSARYEEDRFSGFEYQSSLGMGLGWRFHDDPRTKLIAQIGLGYRQMQTRASLEEDGLTVIPSEQQDALVEQAKIEFEHSLTQTTRVLDQMLVESGVDNTFISNDISLQVKIMGSLALAVGYSVRYNTRPPEGFDTTDTLSTLNLVYEMK